MRCEEQVMKGFHSYRCKRNEWKDGYCKQHHPDTVEARRKKSKEKYEEQKKQSPYYKLREAVERIKELEEEVKELRAKIPSKNPTKEKYFGKKYLL